MNIDWKDRKFQTILAAVVIPLGNIALVMMFRPSPMVAHEPWAIASFSRLVFEQALANVVGALSMAYRGWPFIAIVFAGCCVAELIFAALL
jgi:hypothetical protein